MRDEKKSKNELIEELQALRKKCKELEGSKEKQTREEYRPDYYKTFHENSIQGIIILQNNRIVFADKTAAEISGYSIEELTSFSYEDMSKFIHPDYWPKVKQNIYDRLSNKDIPRRYDIRINRKDGTTRWIELYSSLIDFKGSPAIQATHVDITDLKNTAEELRLQKVYFQQLFENSPEAIIIVDNQDRIQSVNSSFCKLFEYQRDEIIGSKINDLIVPEDKREEATQLSENVLKSKVVKKEAIRKTKTGKNVHIQLLGSPIMLDENQIGVYGIYRDITEQKKLEKGLRQSEKEYRELFENAHDAIIIFRASDEVILEANQAALNLYGYSKDELIGKSLADMTKNVSYGKKKIKEALETGSVVNHETVHFNKNGDELYMEANATRFVYGGEEAILSIQRDVSERLQTQEEIQNYLEELAYKKDQLENNAIELRELNHRLRESEYKLKELNKSKDKLFSIIAHDLRTPFTGFMGFAEYLVDEADEIEPDELKDISSRIYNSARNVFNLLENLLQWSRLQTGRIQFKPGKFDLQALAKQITELNRPIAQTKKLELKNSVREGTYVFGDQLMIDTIIRNLVSNSIKFTEPGGEVAIDAKSDGETVEVIVKDTGVGMDNDTIDKLFRIDVHVTTLGTSEEKGTGLGLILCKDFVEKHGGTIDVESQPGEGSCFKFRLPANKAQFEKLLKRKHEDEII